MNPDPAPPNPKLLSAELVLSGIDVEIARRRQELERPGWTVWALWSALAVVVWLATEEYKVGPPPAISVFWGMALWLTVAMLERSARVFAFAASRAKGTGRFDPVALRAPAPLLAACLATGELIAFGALQFVPDNPVPRWGRAIVLFFLAGHCGGHWMILRMAGGNYFVPRTADSIWAGLKRRSLYLRLFVALILLAILAPLSVYLWGAVTAWPPTPTVVRWALLANAVIWLAVKLPPSGQSDPAIGELQDLRTRLVFGQIALEKAAKEADKIVLGWTADAVLEAQFQGFRARCLSLEQLCLEIEARIARAESVRAEQPDAAGDILALVGRELTEGALPLKLLEEASEELLRRIVELAIQGGDPEALQAIKRKTEFGVMFARHRLNNLAVRCQALTAAKVAAP